MRWTALALHHLRYAALSYRRNFGAAFFGLVFPLMLLTINSAVFGHNKIPVGGQQVPLSGFYVASMSVFAVIMICFNNLALLVLYDRDMGRLKRIRATPTPPSAYVAARLGFAVLLALFATLLCIGEGMAAFGVRVPAGHLWPFLLAILIGSVCFAALSLAVAATIRNAQSGPAILNAVTFPVLFLSSVFFPISALPKWLMTIMSWLPVRPFSDASVAAFFTGEIAWSKLAIVAGWAAFGAVVAARNFQWLPRR